MDIFSFTIDMDIIKPQSNTNDLFTIATILNN